MVIQVLINNDCVVNEITFNLQISITAVLFTVLINLVIGCLSIPKYVPTLLFIFGYWNNISMEINRT